MQTIFHFDDAIEYLNYRLKQAQKSNTRVSIRAWALKLGMQHPMNLTRILKKERRLTPAQAKKIGPKLNLSPEEQNYFELLAQANKTDNTELFKKYHELTLNHKQIPNTLTLKEFKCFSHWFVGPLIEALSLNAEASIENLVRLFSKSVKAEELRDLIQVLLDLSIVQYNENGFIEVTPNRKAVFNIHSSVREGAIENYLAGQLDQSIKAFQNLPVGKRKITSASIALSSEQIDQAKKIIDEAVHKLVKLSQRKGADQVYQFNAQFFPLIETTNA